jgi:hypothetical protein
MSEVMPQGSAPTQHKSGSNGRNSWVSKQAIRQLIGISLTGLVVYETVVTNQIDATVLIGIYGTVLGFYFGEGE